MTYEERAAEAKSYYEEGLERVRTTPEPVGQKYHRGARVRIADDLGQCMRFFPSGCLATVEHTYAHAFGGDDVKSYSLIVDGHGSTAWYNEDQISEAPHA